MSYTRLNIFLLAIFLGSIALSWLLTPNFGRLNPDPLVDMAVSIPYDSFSANGNFKTAAMPLGMTLQELASGTIVYGRIPMHFSPATAAAILAGERLTNPFSATDSAALERGGAVFTNFCFPCHGPMAKGDGPVTTRGFPPPPSIVTGKYPAYKDGQIFHIITYGMNNMPSYAKQILKDDRWRAILYVRGLQQRAAKEEEAARLATRKKIAVSPIQSPGGAGR